MSDLVFPQNEIYKNLKYFAEKRRLSTDYNIIYPEKISNKVTCKQIIKLFNISKFVVVEFGIVDNIKTYAVIYENKKTSSDDIQKIVNAIPGTKSLTRTFIIDINIIIPINFVKTNIINKINKLK